jgi:hypothetical protein
MEDSMTDNKIIEFLKGNIESMDDGIYGNVYCASVLLRDNHFLPCVKFINTKKFVDLSIKRIKECDFSYNIIKHFIVNHNVIKNCDIKEMNKSEYALPRKLLKKIRGETLMSWTGFVFRMDDGNLFNFGTTFDFCFFDLPDGYTFENVKDVINHNFALENGTLKNYRENGLKNFENIQIYREKIFFECFILVHDKNLMYT